MSQPNPPKVGLSWVKLVTAKLPKIGSPLKTEVEAANYLGVSISTFRRVRKDGAIGYCKLKGRYRYTVEQLESYIKSVSVNPCVKNDSKLETIGYLSVKAPLSTMPHGLTNPHVKHAALHLAQKTFMKPK